MKKNIVVAVICLMSMAVFSACSLSEGSSASESDTSDSSDSAVNQIGEAVTCVTEDGAKINITITNYGSTVDGITPILYVDYEIENIGDQLVSIGNSMFSIYADDYTVEQSNLGEKTVILENVAPGKKVAARLYGNINPESVDKIELIVGNVTFAIKGEGVSEEALERRLLREDQVSFASADEEPLIDIEGTYEEFEEIWGSKKEKIVTINLFSSPEGNRVGSAEIEIPMYGTYTGDFVEIKTNVYQLIDQVKPVIISFKINSLQQLYVHVYVNGMNIASIAKKELSENQGNREEEADIYIKENPIAEDSDKDEIKEEKQQEEPSEFEYIFADSSTKRLEKKDVENLNKEQCRLAKNEIYARHGRLFLDESLQKYFNEKSWYSGSIKPEDFDESSLSKIEKENVKLLAKYESKK